MKKGKILVPLTCHSLAKAETVFHFDTLTMDTCGLCLHPSSPPSGIITQIFLWRPLISHSQACGSGVKASRFAAFRALQWASGTILANLYTPSPWPLEWAWAPDGQ